MHNDAFLLLGEYGLAMSRGKKATFEKVSFFPRSPLFLSKPRQHESPSSPAVPIACSLLPNSHYS